MALFSSFLGCEGYVTLYEGQMTPANGQNGT
jgi:hypothetical protein